MNEQEIDDVALEYLIPRAINRDMEALNLLMYSKWLSQLLNRIADWASRKYKVDVDKNGSYVQDVVADTIRSKIHTITNPNNISWRVCLIAYCYTVAKHHCLNVIRHRDVQNKYRHSVGHEDLRSSTMRPQQEEVEQQEKDSLQKNRESKIHQTVWRMINSLPPDDARILSLWAEGNTLQQIAGVTECSVETVRLRLKKLLKVLVKEITKVVVEEIGEETAEEIGVAQILENRNERRAGIRELIANSLAERPACTHVPHARV